MKTANTFKLFFLAIMLMAQLPVQSQTPPIANNDIVLNSLYKKMLTYSVAGVGATAGQYAALNKMEVELNKYVNRLYKEDTQEKQLYSPRAPYKYALATAFLKVVSNFSVLMYMLPSRKEYIDNITTEGLLISAVSSMLIKQMNKEQNKNLSKFQNRQKAKKPHNRGVYSLGNSLDNLTLFKAENRLEIYNLIHELMGVYENDLKTVAGELVMPVAGSMVINRAAIGNAGMEVSSAMESINLMKTITTDVDFSIDSIENVLDNLSMAGGALNIDIAGNVLKELDIEGLHPDFEAINGKIASVVNMGNSLKNKLQSQFGQFSKNASDLTALASFDPATAAQQASNFAELLKHGSIGGQGGGYNVVEGTDGGKNALNGIDADKQTFFEELLDSVAEFFGFVVDKPDFLDEIKESIDEITVEVGDEVADEVADGSFGSLSPTANVGLNNATNNATQLTEDEIEALKEADFSEEQTTQIQNNISSAATITETAEADKQIITEEYNNQASGQKWTEEEYAAKIKEIDDNAREIIAENNSEVYDADGSSAELHKSDPYSTFKTKEIKVYRSINCDPSSRLYAGRILCRHDRGTFIEVKTGTKFNTYDNADNAIIEKVQSQENKINDVIDDDGRLEDFIDQIYQ
jgi:hypothetical protein